MSATQLPWGEGLGVFSFISSPANVASMEWDPVESSRCAPGTDRGQKNMGKL